MPNDTSLHSDLETLRGTSIATLIRAKIEEEIISGQRQGGDHLSEKELTINFGVSRGPVREALRTLEGQGLLEQKKNKGWFVKLLSRKEVKDVFELRGFLDYGIATILVNSVTKTNNNTGIKTLQNLVKDMDSALESNNSGLYAKLNQEFHFTLLAMAGNNYLTKTYRNMMGELASQVANSLKLDSAMNRSNSEHHEMINAIIEKDEKRLRTIFSAHRMETQKRMSRVSDVQDE